MVRFRVFAGCLAVLAIGAGAQAEQRTPGGGGYVLKPLVAPVSAAAPAPAALSPYAMTYSEQAARRLGVQDGGLGLLPRQDGNPYAPSVSFNGSTIRLKWRP
jgi:hypothetical protein